MNTTNNSKCGFKRTVFLQVPGSVVAWLGLVAYLIASKYILTFLPPINIKVIASEFAWSTIVIYAAIGLIGVLLSLKTGFTDALDDRVSNQQRFLLPITIGAALGILAIVLDQFTHGSEFLESQSGEASFNVYFPASLFVYSGGIVLVEAVFRIFAVPFLLWLISNLFLHGHGQNQTFWVLAILLSLFEPVTQGLGVIFLKPSANPIPLLLTQFLPYFITNYPLNLGQAVFFRKYGFLASFTMRLGFYIMWHVVYGNFIYPLLG